MIGCTRTAVLLAQRAAGLSAAEALRVEEHLASCEPCTRDAELLCGLRSLSLRDGPELPREARENVIRRALLQAGSETRVANKSGLRFTWAFALAGSFALAAALLLGPRLFPEPKAAVVVDANRSFRTARATRVVLAHASVELAAGTFAYWDAAKRHLQLEKGSVRADVDESAQRSWSVGTPRFTVHVLGTRFSVALDAVSVQRGRVRIVAKDGTVLMAALSAGERYEYREPQAPTASVVRVQPEQRKAEPTPQRASLASLLPQVRQHLGAQQLSRARALLEQAETLPGTPRERADAMALSAETALLAGDIEGAVQAYLRTARRFGKSTAGENALFAAARLEAERGRLAAAAQLLERYLAHYPRGRFITEAKVRLRAFGDGPIPKP